MAIMDNASRLGKIDKEYITEFKVVQTSVREMKYYKGTV
jgi:hypothetical protein